jgi:hypothetical protein
MNGGNEDEKLEGKRPLGKPRCRRYNIKMDLKWVWTELNCFRKESQGTPRLLVLAQML